MSLILDSILQTFSDDSLDAAMALAMMTSKPHLCVLAPHSMSHYAITTPMLRLIRRAPTYSFSVKLALWGKDITDHLIIDLLDKREFFWIKNVHIVNASITAVGLRVILAIPTLDQLDIESCESVPESAYVDMLRHPKENIRYNACRNINYACKELSTAIDDAVKAGAVPPSRRLQESLIAAGALPELVSMLENGVAEAATWREAINSLGWIVRGLDPGVLTVQAVRPTIPAAATMLGCRDLDVQRLAAVYVCNILSVEESLPNEARPIAQMIAGDTTMPQDLAALVKNHRSRWNFKSSCLALSDACGALSRLSLGSQDETQRRAIFFGNSLSSLYNCFFKLALQTVATPKSSVVGIDHDDDDDDDAAAAVHATTLLDLGVDHDAATSPEPKKISPVVVSSGGKALDGYQLLACEQMCDHVEDAMVDFESVRELFNSSVSANNDSSDGASSVVVVGDHFEVDDDLVASLVKMVAEKRLPKELRTAALEALGAAIYTLREVVNAHEEDGDPLPAHFAETRALVLDVLESHALYQDVLLGVAQECASVLCALRNNDLAGFETVQILREPYDTRKLVCAALKTATDFVCASREAVPDSFSDISESDLNTLHQLEEEINQPRANVDVSAQAGLLLIALGHLPMQHRVLEEALRGHQLVAPDARSNKTTKKQSPSSKKTSKTAKKAVAATRTATKKKSSEKSKSGGRKKSTSRTPVVASRQKKAAPSKKRNTAAGGTKKVTKNKKAKTSAGSGKRAATKKVSVTKTTRKEQVTKKNRK